MTKEDVRAVIDKVFERLVREEFQERIAALEERVRALELGALLPRYMVESSPYEVIPDVLTPSNRPEYTTTGDAIHIPTSSVTSGPDYCTTLDSMYLNALNDGGRIVYHPPMALEPIEVSFEISVDLEQPS